MARPFRFAIVGSGWRSEFHIRMAKAAPDRLQVAAVVTRTPAEAERIAVRWGVPNVRTIGEALALRDGTQPVLTAVGQRGEDDRATEAAPAS